MLWGEFLGCCADEIAILNELAVALFTEKETILKKFPRDFLLEIYFEIVTHVNE